MEKKEKVVKEADLHSNLVIFKSNKPVSALQAKNLNLHSNLVIFKFFNCFIKIKMFHLHLHSNLVIFKLQGVNILGSTVTGFTFQSGDIQILNHYHRKQYHFDHLHSNLVIFK